MLQKISLMELQTQIQEAWNNRETVERKNLH
jgi:hypothetical protein